MGCCGSKSVSKSSSKPPLQLPKDEPFKQPVVVAEESAKNEAAQEESQPLKPTEKLVEPNNSGGIFAPQEIAAEDEQEKPEVKLSSQEPPLKVNSTTAKNLAESEINKEVDQNDKKQTLKPTGTSTSSSPPSQDKQLGAVKPFNDIKDNEKDGDDDEEEEEKEKEAKSSLLVDVNEPNGVDDKTTTIVAQSDPAEEDPGEAHGASEKILEALQSGEAEVAEAIRKGDDKVARWLIPPTPTSVASEQHTSNSNKVFKGYADSDAWSLSSRKTAPMVMIDSSTIGLDAFAEWLLPPQKSRSKSVKVGRSSYTKRPQTQRSFSEHTSPNKAKPAPEKVITTDYIVDDFRSIIAGLRKLGDPETYNFASATARESTASEPVSADRRSSASSDASSASNGRLKRGRVASLETDEFQMRFRSGEHEGENSYSFRDMNLS